MWFKKKNGCKFFDILAIERCDLHPFPEIWVNLCHFDPKNIAEVIIGDIGGEVIKIPEASSLDFWYVPSQSSPSGNSGDRRGNAQVMWRGHKNPSWTRFSVILTSAPDVTEDSSSSSLPATVGVLSAGSPDTTKQRVAVPAESPVQGPLNPQAWQKNCCSHCRIGVVDYATIVSWKPGISLVKMTYILPFDLLNKC